MTSSTTKNISLLLLIAITIFSCDSRESDTENITPKTTEKDSTISHGYNELANPSELKQFCISDYNTDNPDIKNIERPSKSSINTSLDTSLLFSIWVANPNGPHADFIFSSHSFYVVDYDGDGDMPYVLENKNLKIYYNDFIQEGEIISVGNDSLNIKWKGFSQMNSYVRWKE